ncbi:MAG TPA: glycosyltransferase family 39 protein [Phycisphaerae bacterium]|nr:glycosyltransferase family 39 protein [Phycisphaerae bacterium]
MERHSTADPPLRTRHVAAAALLELCLVLGIALRIWAIHRRPIWVDEAFSILYATVDWAEVVQMRRLGTNPPLYHFLLSGWVGLFGTSAAAIRLMSALVSVVSIGVLYALARRVSCRTTAAIAVALLAVCNFSVAYAQEARFYALIQLLSLISSLFLCRLIERQNLRDAAGYAVATSALLWTHTFGWFVLAAQVVWLLTAWRDPPPPGTPRRRLIRLGLLSITLAVLSFLPWVPVLLQQIAEVQRGYWIAEPSWTALAQAAHHMLVLVRPLRWPIVVVGVVMALHWLIARIRSRSVGQPTQTVPSDEPGRKRIRRCHLWGLLAWTALPILIPFVWSRFSTPIFQVKYAIVAQAPALILFAALLTRRPVLGVAVLALLTGFWPPNRDRDLVVEEWPQAADILIQQNTTGATVFVYQDYAYFPLEYYLKGRCRVRPVYTEGQAPNAFAPYYPDDATTFDEMLSYLAESDEPEIWFVLRWGCPRERAQLHDRIAALREIDSIWELRCVDVIRLR